MFEEDDAEMLTPNYWTTTADENVAAIDAILNHRIRQDISIIFSSIISECSDSLQTRTSTILEGTTLNIMYVHPCGHMVISYVHATNCCLSVGQMARQGTLSRYLGE